MKRFLSLLLTVALVACAFAALALHTTAATADDAATGANKLTVTCRGLTLGEVAVGNEFIYHVAMNSAGYSIFGGQAEVNYNSAYVKIVEHGPVRSNGSVSMSEYCFPTRITNSSLAASYFDTQNQINYNFAKVSGVGSFTESDHFFKIRFKAIAPGTVEIRHYATSFYAKNATRLFRFDKGNDQLDPIPYTLCSIEPATALIGDADGDYELTVMDATFIQKVTAGAKNAYNKTNADANKDNAVDLKDALTVMRYKAGIATNTQIGEWIFTSEQTA